MIANSIIANVTSIRAKPRSPRERCAASDSRRADLEGSSLRGGMAIPFALSAVPAAAHPPPGRSLAAAAARRRARGRLGVKIGSGRLHADRRGPDERTDLRAVGHVGVRSAQTGMRTVCRRPGTNSNASGGRLGTERECHRPRAARRGQPHREPAATPPAGPLARRRRLRRLPASRRGRRRSRTGAGAAARNDRHPQRRGRPGPSARRPCSRTVEPNVSTSSGPPSASPVHASASRRRRPHRSVRKTSNRAAPGRSATRVIERFQNSSWSECAAAPRWTTGGASRRRRAPGRPRKGRSGR